VQKIVVNSTGNFTPTSNASRSDAGWEDKILKIAASLAVNSEHPLSKAITQYAKEKNSEIKSFTNFKEVKGKGMTALCEEHNKVVMLGNKKILEDNKIDTKWAEGVLSNSSIGSGTRLFVVHGEDGVVGSIIVADEVREESKKVVEKLKSKSIKVAMITGDHQNVANSIAEELGIENVLADVLPSEKSQEVKKKQEAGEKVVFVGDGINDAPSLAQADLGIAMGGASDIAKEAGQIVLINNNLHRVYDAIGISGATFDTIKQNLFWAFAYNVVAIPLAAFGFLNPIIAAGAMSFSSVSVVLNSLRLKNSKI
jgi:Cu+-exporting ATPase